MKSKTTHFRVFQILFFTLVALLPVALMATHNRAGEIHIEQLGPLTIRATIITWTKTSSFTVDRDSLKICWGDGTCEDIGRSNGQGISLPNDIKYNTYVAIHTYAGQATYSISMTDQNRIAGIINVNPPASDFIPFHIATTYTFQDIQFGGTNTTPYLLQPPIDNACIGKAFKHNPNAYDPDGDSLSYKLIVPLQLPNQQVPNYRFPNQVSPGANNLLQLNPVTGDLLWFTPQEVGDYNIAIAIISWRNGTPIDTTIRDMQIKVDNCNNNPPVVTAEGEYCVVAGQTVTFPVVATDPDSTDYVRLTALGGPFSTPFSPATFSAPVGWNVPPVSGIFEWVTDCEHISDQPYSVVFKATDSVSVTFPKLSDLKTVTIKVVGPAPEDVQAQVGSGQVEISWAKPFICETSDNDNFYGFSVWRKEGSNLFPPDTCSPGLAGKGYTELVYVTRNAQNGRYYYKDTNVEQGRTYCYRVEAKFAQNSAGGFPFNIVEGLPSAEVCVQLPRDIPVITHATVESTSNTNGSIQVCWSKPIAADLDTIMNPGPYRYQVLRANGLTGGQLVEIPGASFVAPTFWQANDTCFTDINLNTTDGPYHYAVAFYVNGNATPLGSTNNASSVFLSVASTDKRNTLSWQAAVPWGNYLYEVYRLNENTGDFDLIGTTTTPTYKDLGLENGRNYCYKIRALGTYGVAGIVSPLYNWSQERCGIPLDTMPPCPPQLTISNRCNTGVAITEPDPPFENALAWTNPNQLCPETDDTDRYRVWYKATTDGTFELLTTVNGAENTQFTHELMEGLAGCYAVTAIDVEGNESALSNVVCVDNCPEYLLPNTFTPNGDGDNDVFKPFPGWRFVDQVDMQIFNRWGNLVFKTQDPALDWNGTATNGKRVSDGTYYYICKVFASGLAPAQTATVTLSGWIEILGGE